ncbi:MAG: low molecular weight phosphotyrosine protein phosphatase [Bifidobacteriaceae bacterium]|jgi:protein-tyrosine phosphatase|nr:low molecular weight phosphotyrosine protein phosphatase [Bifidobacteriaceae bacterium]
MTYIINAVCTGNICRSAMAEIVLKQAFAEAGLGVKVISKAISDEEKGNPIDSRAVESLEDKGFVVGEHKAKSITKTDLKEDNLFLAMTRKHAKYLLKIGASGKKVYMYRQFENSSSPEPYVNRDGSVDDIIDPWYGDQEDFDIALDQIMDCTNNIVKFVEWEINYIGSE